jgi:hypothetical protein
LINPRLIRLKMLPAFFLIMPISVLSSIFISLSFGESISQSTTTVFFGVISPSFLIGT